MGIQVCSDPTHFCVEPEIYFVIPISEEIPLHQEIRFLSYHIRLPAPPKIKDMDRQSLILQFFSEDELSAQDGQALHAISFIGVMSELDHPILEKLMLSVK